MHETDWVIDDWAIVKSTVHADDAGRLVPQDAFIAPEMRPFCGRLRAAQVNDGRPQGSASVVGKCLQRPGFEQGFVTSPILEVQGRCVRTINESRYVLGKPDPAFVVQCADKGWHVPTDEQPILVRSSWES